MTEEEYRAAPRLASPKRDEQGRDTTLRVDIGVARPKPSSSKRRSRRRWRRRPAIAAMLAERKAWAENDPPRLPSGEILYPTYLTLCYIRAHGYPA